MIKNGSNADCSVLCLFHMGFKSAFFYSVVRCDGNVLHSSSWLVWVF